MGALGCPDGPWFNEIAAWLGRTYWAPATGRVMAFTTGTEQEVGFLVQALGLEPGMRVLDVGCGPGRHALALARRGIAVHGVDLSDEFVTLARESAEELPVSFDVLDVRELPWEADYDAAICLCQGGFGLLGGEEDAALVARITRAVRPGGALALTAFSSYFALRGLEEGEVFDPATGVLQERATLRNDSGEQREFDLWTTCFTTRELGLLATAAGLAVDGIFGVRPGAYGRSAPSLDDPELLLLARRPRAR